MDELYLVEFESGDTRFRVKSSNKAWASEQLERMLILSQNQPLQSATVNPPAQDEPLTEETVAQTPADITSQNPLAVIWNEAIAQELQLYITQRRPAFERSSTKQAAIIASFLEDELGIDALTPADLEFIYRRLNLATISHEAQFKNATIRDKYFDNTNGAWHLTHAGRVFGRDTSRNN